MTSNPSTTASSTQTLGNGGAPPTDDDEGAVQAVVTRVANEAPAQAARVVDDARTQLSDAARRTLADLRAQADDRSARAAHGLRDLSVQVDALAQGRPDQAGNLTDIAQAVGQHAADFADRLDARGVQGVADDVSRFGRRHPWAFLGLSLGAGFLVGRLVRTTAEVASDAQPDQARLSSPGAAALDPSPPATTSSNAEIGRSMPGGQP